MTKEALPYFSTVLGAHYLLTVSFVYYVNFVGFRKNFLDNPADFFLDKIIAVEQGLNVPRQYKASDGMYMNITIHMFIYVENIHL